MNKERFKKIAGWASLLRNSTSIIATLISFVTLIILIRQNERTYRPDLVFAAEHPHFSVKYEAAPTQCQDIQVRVGSDSVVQALYLIASNLGLGAAKDLHLTWQYDAARLVDTVRIGAFQVPTSAKYVADVNGFLLRNCYRKEDNESFEEYCLPVTSEKTPLRVSIPESYLEMWSNVLIRIGHTLDLTNEQYTDLLMEFVGTYQSLILKTDYRDINNRSYTKRYAVRLIPRFIDLSKKEMVIGISLKALGGPKIPPRKYIASISFPNGRWREVPLEL